MQTRQIIDRIRTDRRYTEEGFLIVPARIARTGIQEYRAFELGLNDGDPMRIVKVYRPEDEVFSADAMASFENKPVTNNHPDEFVDAKNWKELSVGFARNVKRDGKYLAADLIITDQNAIDMVVGGKVELSNGYTADYDWTPGKTPDGEAYDAVQRNIRGNHVAIVDAARCGPACRVGDSEMVVDYNENQPRDPDGKWSSGAGSSASAAGNAAAAMAGAHEISGSTNVIRTEHSNGAFSVTVGAASGNHAAKAAIHARRELRASGFAEESERTSSKRGTTHTVFSHPSGMSAVVSNSIASAPGRGSVRVTVYPKGVKAADALQSEYEEGERPMADRKVTIDGIPFELPEAAAAAVEKLVTARDAAMAKAETADKALTDANQKHTEAIAAKDAEIETLKKDVMTPDQRDAMVEAWAKLTADAKRLVPDFDHKGKTCDAIRREVLSKLDAKFKPVADAVLAGKALDAADADTVKMAFNAVAALPAQDQRSNDADPVADAMRKHAQGDGQPEVGGRDAYIQRMQDAWKPQQNEKE